ncbi:MAG: small acid-soluble spore protein SspI [Bacilli bacterium]|nr:small acid-soluble spore protein SspI [Bacilli bacterium]
MNSDIKDYIINNFKDDDISVIRDAIIDSIDSNDEVALPGLGIFFVMNWECCNDKEKDLVVKRIFKQIKKG